jgi:hypothetical protein
MWRGWKYITTQLSRGYGPLCFTVSRASEASFLILEAGSRNKGRRLVQRQLLDRDM